MADRDDGDAVSGDMRERDTGRPRRHTKPPQRYMDEVWEPLKQRATVEEVDKQSLSEISSHQPKVSSYSNSGVSRSSSKSSETRKQLHLHELKLLQAKREAEARELEERRLVEEELRRREDERRLQESRRIREIEYETEQLRLKARLEEDEENCDPESLANRLRDFDGDGKEDHKFEEVNAQSTPRQVDKRALRCNSTQTPRHSVSEQEERLNVSWVQKLCGGESNLSPSPLNSGEPKSIFPRSLPKLDLPRFDGNPLEWPTFISLFKCLVHDQPLTDTQRMTHLQRALVGNAKRAVEGMLTHGHLYREALKELEEQFGNEESVAGAYLKTIFDHPIVCEDNFAQLRSFYNTLHVAVSTLKSLGYEHDLAATDNLRRAVQKLPETIKTRWGEKRVEMLSKTATLADLDKWLRERVRAKSMISDQTLNSSQTKEMPKQGYGRRNNRNRPPKDETKGAEFSTLTTTVSGKREVTRPPVKCPVCSQVHKVEDCPDFKNLDVDQRAQRAKEKSLCFRCLNSSEHRAKQCTERRGCGVDNCPKHHHPLIHGAAPVFVGAAAVGCGSPGVLLQIVPLVVQTPKGDSVHTYALLDSGSQASLVLETFADDVGLEGPKEVLTIGTINSTEECKPSRKVSFSVKAVSDDNVAMPIPISEAWTVPRLNLPRQRVTRSEMQAWPHVADIEIPEVDSQNVTVLLGANVLEAILQHEVRRGAPGQPAAVRTAFGWTLTGSVKGFIAPESFHVMHIHTVPSSDDLLHKQMQNWWRTDSFGTKYEQASPRSIEDKKALKILEETVKHVGDRYQVGMLWKRPDVEFPDNKAMAEKRLTSTEKALKRDDALAEKYKEIIDGYVAKGFARKLSPEEAAVPVKKQWFLPHHPVLNPNKPGKVRMVMDARAKCNGVSLNDELLVGPDLLNNLCGVLLRFREERVAIAADIESMFHQCLVMERDQPALRFMWRNLETTRDPDVYQMLVMIFGAASSPCTANYVLRKTADDNREDPSFSPETIEAVRRNFYMDDLLKSVKDETSAIRLQSELTVLLARGGFRLTKWSSSSREVLSEIPNQEMASPSVKLDLDELPVERSLGLLWNTETDSFRFAVSSRHSALTKRGVLSQLSSVFDPFGVLAPFLLPAKCLIQDLWRKKQGWDVPLDEGDRVIWENWLADLSSLRVFELSRRLCSESPRDVQVELHVFGDASERGFGAVCYARLVLRDGRIEVAFVMAKTRVAPLKQLSIPRLELQAALLAVRLADTIKKELTLHTSKTVFWSDSKTVLLYILNESRRFHTFVANRVAEIQDSTSPEQWRFVPGRLNPADDCTRGLRASGMTSDCRWIAGPAFLYETEELWPTEDFTGLIPEGDAELKKSAWCGLLIDPAESQPDPAKFSSWTRFRRVIAWMYRFIDNARLTSERRATGLLSVDELTRAELIAVKRAQMESFPDDCEALLKNLPLPPKSKLLALNPYVDENGLLRVGGRLRKAPLPEETRHPVVLDPKHEVTRLVIQYCHLQSRCAGDAQVLNNLRQRYWVLKGVRAVHKVSLECPTCRWRRAQPRPPVMADLPKPRLGYSLPPFTYTGVDYFGPILVKCGRRTEKRYGVLFTCMTTRAVHLEIAHSLETDAYIMAMQRMVSRRGRPAHIWSDNGTNFVGADREVQEALKRLNKEKITDEMSQHGVQWHFNPPAAPHFGGVWERLVKSAKRALKAIVGNQRVTDETLLTFMAEAESLMNGRPLTHVSSDCNDLEALTPNHFLLGRANLNIPLDVVTDRDLCSRKRWKHAQVMANHFWERWLHEYLPSRTVRPKWCRESRDIAEGDLVLMMSDNLPRGRWPLARVTRIVRGDDGRVRSADVKTKTGEYLRPVTKLCLMEEVSDY